jgi:hypothetical protein
VSVRKIAIDFERSPGRIRRFGTRFPRGFHTKVIEKGIALGQPGVRHAIARIFLDGLLKVLIRLLQGAAIPVVMAFEIELVGLSVLGVALGQPIPLLAGGS